MAKSLSVPIYGKKDKCIRISVDLNNLLKDEEIWASYEIQLNSQNDS